MNAPEILTLDLLPLAQQRLLEPAGLDADKLSGLLGGLLRPGVDAADLYFQSSESESWVLEDGIIKTGSHHAGVGVGVRAISGEKTGFAYSDEISLPALAESSRAVTAIVRQGQQGRVQTWTRTPAPMLYAAVDPLSSWPTEKKLELLRRADTAARAADPAVTQVMASLMGSRELVLVAAADGTLAADLRPLVRLSVSVIAERNGRREQAQSGAGGRGTYADFFGGDAVERHAREAVRQVCVALEAGPAPAGNMTVVLGPGWPGVLLHEAIGHGLEGDFNRKGTSAFAGRIGERVASELCTVVDDGTLPGRRGSLSMDDEGVPSQCTTLIENGILKGYIQDKLNARLMGLTPTGNGRRESFAHLPMPRMTNTYMRAGPHDPAEIITSVKKGLYAVNFAGGQVDITSGNFVFSASEAYLIEDGRITRPVKGATLVGNGPEVLTRVSMVGHDLQLDQGIGVCGKDGQSVPVGVGQPTLRVDGLTVGGTQQ
jgi:TldD protein